MPGQSISGFSAYSGNSGFSDGFGDSVSKFERYRTAPPFPQTVEEWGGFVTRWLYRVSPERLPGHASIREASQRRVFA